MADEKDGKWQCYIIPDLATWTGAAGNKPHIPNSLVPLLDAGMLLSVQNKKNML